MWLVVDLKGAPSQQPGSFGGMINSQAIGAITEPCRFLRQDRHDRCSNSSGAESENGPTQVRLWPISRLGASPGHIQTNNPAHPK